jgi:hypothetical protein
VERETVDARDRVRRLEGFVPGEVVSVKVKGKKVIVKGKAPGTVTVISDVSKASSTVRSFKQPL